MNLSSTVLAASSRLSVRSGVEKSGMLIEGENVHQQHDVHGLGADAAFLQALLRAGDGDDQPSRPSANRAGRTGWRRTAHVRGSSASRARR